MPVHSSKGRYKKVISGEGGGGGKWGTEQDFHIFLNKKSNRALNSKLIQIDLFQ